MATFLYVCAGVIVGGAFLAMLAMQVHLCNEASVMNARWTDIWRATLRIEEDMKREKGD